MTRTPGLLALLVLLSACRKGDAVPSYVHIPAISVQAGPEFGGGTSKITDAWVSVNDRSLGSWELPARVPVIGQGRVTITVTPGVKRNGSYDDRLRYPYYSTWQTSLELIPERSTTIDPQVSYVPSTSVWAERFNEAGNALIVSGSSDTSLIVHTAPELLLDASPCAGFALDADHTDFSAYTDQDFNGAFGPVFVELDYSTDVPLTFGLAYTEGGDESSEPWVVLVATTSEGGQRWNKVYIDVTEFFNVAGLTDRDFYLAATLPSGRLFANVFIENLKLVRPTS